LSNLGGHNCSLTIILRQLIGQLKIYIKKWILIKKLKQAKNDQKAYIALFIFSCPKIVV